MTDPVRFLLAPTGQAGSGRVRYGAAMELWRQGRISAEVLEVYRIASAHDSWDPAATLRERGLPVPGKLPNEDPLSHLYTAARDYLLALGHPGAEDVRAKLPADPGHVRRLPARGHAITDRFLDAALSAVPDQPTLTAAIAKAAPLLQWTTYDGYPPEQIGPAFPAGHSFASILGAEAPFAATDFDLGLFLMAPGTLYRDHRHAAPELYAPLTGPHGWRFGPGRPLIVKPAHAPVWNPPHQVHLTLVGPVPFLSLFVWTKNVNSPAEVVPADDWHRLERMTLD